MATDAAYAWLRDCTISVGIVGTILYHAHPKLNCSVFGAIYCIWKYN